MTDLPIGSAVEFAYELGHVIERYLRHFEPTAPTEADTVRLEVSGAGLGLIYTQHGGAPATLQLSLNNPIRTS
jgi:hypothetical protein